MTISKDNYFGSEMDLKMGKKCGHCGKEMKNQELTHCSDECLFAEIKKSRKL